MTRKTPKTSTLKALFAKSGNQCAFPECDHPLVDDSDHVFADVCHIEASAPHGPRYNSAQTDEERQSHDNLILLCPNHHKRIDLDVQSFTVEKLKEMREEHESAQTRDYRISQTALSKFASEIAEYWKDVELLNTVKHVISDRAVPIDPYSTFSEVLQNVASLISDIEDVGVYLRESDDLLMEDLLKLLKSIGLDTAKVQEVKYFENPFILRNWETHNLMFRNILTRLKVLIPQLEIKYLEEYLKMNADDISARDRLETLREEFRVIAQRAGLAD